MDSAVALGDSSIRDLTRMPLLAQFIAQGGKSAYHNAMATTFEKLNLKDQREIVVLDAPESFVPQLAGLHGVTIHRNLRAGGDICFFLAFVTRKREVDNLAPRIAKLAPGDPIVWFAYPKGASKKYQCDFNRDTGWDAMTALGFETVRAVAIDEDWSALRFRRGEFVKAGKR